MMRFGADLLPMCYKSSGGGSNPEGPPDLRTLLRMLFGVAVGGAAAFLLLSISRSGSWGGLVLNAPERPKRDEPAALEDEPSPVETEPGGPSEDRTSVDLGWVKACAVTHKGLVREENQDRYLLEELPGQGGLLALVTDGMGGHSGGSVAADVASRTIGGIMRTVVPEDPEAVYQRLTDSFVKADEAIRHRASKQTVLSGMGTTAVAAVVGPEQVVHVHTGDSRLYHFRDGRELYRTRDHSVVRYLQEEGMVSEEEARVHPMRSRLTSSLGGSPPERRITLEPRWKSSSEAQPAVLEMQPGDVVMLCSDGLNSEVESDRITGLAKEHGRDVKALANHYLNAALEAGGRDNVTVIVIRRER